MVGAALQPLWGAAPGVLTPRSGLGSTGPALGQAQAPERQLAALWQVSEKQGVPSCSGAPTHLPVASQAAVARQGSVDSHGVPTGSLVSSQLPVVGSHLLATQGPDAGHSLIVPTQLPPEHLAALTHLLSDVQGTSFITLSVAHCPSVARHTPTLQTGAVSEQFLAVPLQVPALQVPSV